MNSIDAVSAWLRNMQRRRVHAGGQRPLALAVSAVRPPVPPGYLGNHYGTNRPLGATEQLLHIDNTVLELAQR